jgi:hypothetical protein
MASIISAGTTSGTALNMAGDTSGVLQLATNGSTTALTIDASQNVGIGTASPFSAAGYKSLTINGSTTGLLAIQANSANSCYFYSDGSAFNIKGVQNIPMDFYTNDTYRMRIEAAGNIRINNTGGLDGQLAVVGTDYAVACANTNTNTPPVYSWNRATAGNNIFMVFYTETVGQTRGSIDYNRGANQTRYNTTSDQRLKENIVDAPSATDLINSVKIRSFDWKETGFHVDYGVIAQELNEVVPDAVSVGEDDENGEIKRAWGVDTSVLVPALVKAIQEQQTIINDLKARITALEGAA